jgi:hypothetical protein
MRKSILLREHRVCNYAAAGLSTGGCYELGKFEHEFIGGIFSVYDERPLSGR